MIGSVLQRLFHRPEKEPGTPMVLCPGCGGRGRFEWHQDHALPHQWSWDAPCGMCAGGGRIPGSWFRDRPTAHGGRLRSATILETLGRAPLLRRDVASRRGPPDDPRLRRGGAPTWRVGCCA
jgi:hypothetical protein